MGEWKKEAREKHSQVMKASHARRRAERAERLLKMERKENLKKSVRSPKDILKEVISEVSQLRAKIAVIEHHEKDLLASVSGMMASRERDLYKWLRKEFSDYLKSEALSEAVMARISFYGATTIEAECKRLVNALEMQPQMSLVERLKASLNVLRNGK
jgi:hypothetical protein